jgi:hypothetical protein
MKASRASSSRNVANGGKTDIPSRASRNPSAVSVQKKSTLHFAAPRRERMLKPPHFSPTNVRPDGWKMSISFAGDSPSRFVIPAAGLTALGLFALVYVKYPNIYKTAITVIIDLPGPYPFMDWEYIPSAVRCWTQGVDVYTSNTCYKAAHDFWVYSPLLLRFGFIRYAEGWINLFGLSFASIFFLSLALLPPPRTATFDFAIMALSAISSVTVFALERANLDIVMFVMIVVGISACRTRLPVRLAGYALITVAGLLKFYPMVALIVAIRERPAILATVALAAMVAVGGLVLSYHEELVRITHNFLPGELFHPLEFSVYDLPAGLGVIMSKVVMRLFHQNATTAQATSQFVYHSALLLLIVSILAAAIWLGRHSRLQNTLEQLEKREHDFLLAGAAIICGCFFAFENSRYRGIFLLPAVPGLLVLSHQLSLPWARVALRRTCVAIVFVLWFPFVERCVRAAVAGLAGLVNLNDQEIDRVLRVAMWGCDQLAWSWIVMVLLGALVVLVQNSEIWAAFSRILSVVQGGPRG